MYLELKDFFPYIQTFISENEAFPKQYSTMNEHFFLAPLNLLFLLYNIQLKIGGTMY